MEIKTIDHEIEYMVCCGFIAVPSLFLENENLKEDDFSDPDWGKIWATAEKIAHEGRAVDIVVVSKALNLDYETNLMLAKSVMKAYTKELTLELVHTLLENSQKRKLKALVDTAMTEGKSLEGLGDEIEKIEIRRVSLVSDRQINREAVEGLKTKQECYSTGIMRLDEAMGGGLYAGKLYGLAARKKVGKTLMLGSISFNMNKLGTSHLFLTMEMSPLEIAHRNLGRMTGRNSMRFLEDKEDNFPYQAAMATESHPNNVFYSHKPGISFSEMKKSLLLAVKKYKIKGFILDYWQLVGGKESKETEEYHLRTVAQWLADFCRKQNVWGLVAAQLNQEGNTRGGEGLKLACDMYFSLIREKGDPEAKMDMEESRYTKYQEVTGLYLDSKGPHFREIGNEATGGRFERVD